MTKEPLSRILINKIYWYEIAKEVVVIGMIGNLNIRNVD